MARARPPVLGMARFLCLLATLAFALAALPAATAYDEQEAGLLRGDVLEVSHSPAVVAPHTQWTGVLRLGPGSPVVAAQYQVCRVGFACFAPPAPARGDGNGTFTFDTSGYLAGGHPVDFLAGWRIGVLWVLAERGANGTHLVDFPAGPAASDPACSSDAQALVCQEEHYFTFDMPPAAQAAPGLGALPLVAGLAGAAGWRLRRGHA